MAVKEEGAKLLSNLLTSLIDPHEPDKSQCQVRFRRGLKALNDAWVIAAENV